MKKINPTQIWDNGILKTAHWILVKSSYDDLLSEAVFCFQLFENIDNTEMPGQMITSGNLTISGQDYQNWNSDPDINTSAYIWVTGQLNITLQ